MTTTPPTPDWQFRILAEKANGTVPQGAACLVSPRHVLTCAHVVRNAVAPGPAGPGSRVTLDAPRADPAWHSAATVVDGGWWSGDASPWDIAVLVLDARAPAEPAPRGAPWRPGRRIRIVGGPASDAGRWLHGVLRGSGGRYAEFAQLDVDTGAALGVVRGYSGSGVRDEEEDTLLGVVTEQAAEGRVGWMIPLDVIPRIWEPEPGAAPPAVPLDARDERRLLRGLALKVSRLHTVLLPDSRASFALGLDERLRSWVRLDQDAFSFSHRVVEAAHREYGVLEDVLEDLEAREQGSAGMREVWSAAAPLLGRA
ncbi:trypsin-like serine peptidase [Nocardiopsis sp. NPDC057823]|uniref:trypsin-like serine peptidase n=1 Tax=Nocardiopsis sp. NPDC057823 TaxID=3346256 RepID=UPI00366E5E74